MTIDISLTGDHERDVVPRNGFGGKLGKNSPKVPLARKPPYWQRKTIRDPAFANMIDA